MHPLAGNLSELKDSEIESKISYLTNVYFRVQDPGMKMQVASLLESYNEEIGKRRAEQLKKLMDKRDKSLDSLIKVS